MQGSPFHTPASGTSTDFASNRIIPETNLLSQLYFFLFGYSLKTILKNCVFKFPGNPSNECISASMLAELSTYDQKKREQIYAAFEKNKELLISLRMCQQTNSFQSYQVLASSVANLLPFIDNIPEDDEAVAQYDTSNQIDPLINKIFERFELYYDAVTSFLVDKPDYENFLPETTNSVTTAKGEEFITQIYKSYAEQAKQEEPRAQLFPADLIGGEQETPVSFKKTKPRRSLLDYKPPLLSTKWKTALGVIGLGIGCALTLTGVFSPVGLILKALSIKMMLHGTALTIAKAGIDAGSALLTGAATAATLAGAKISGKKLVTKCRRTQDVKLAPDSDEEDLQYSEPEFDFSQGAASPTKFPVKEEKEQFTSCLSLLWKTHKPKEELVNSENTNVRSCCIL